MIILKFLWIILSLLKVSLNTKDIQKGIPFSLNEVRRLFNSLKEGFFYKYTYLYSYSRILKDILKEMLSFSNMGFQGCFERYFKIPNRRFLRLFQAWCLRIFVEECSKPLKRGFIRIFFEGYFNLFQRRF